MWVEGWGHLPGRLVVVSGPSGSGKSSVIRKALDAPGLNIRHSVSATTRAPRPGERPGVDYFFMSPDEFQAALTAGHFLESALYNGQHYGTPATPVYQTLKEGRSVLLEIEVQGAKQIRDNAPSALFLFLRTPTFPILEERLRGRGTESEPSIHRRLKTARLELAEAHWYDQQIINDNFDRCVEEFTAILKANGCCGGESRDA